jgi:hypothetical protein
MTVVDMGDYVALVRSELEAVEVPAGEPRLSGVADLDVVLRVTANDIAWMVEATSDGSLTPADATAAACGRAREITSMLYAAGAPAAVWRRWAGLSAFGLVLGLDDSGVAEAAQYALIGGEWRLAADLPRQPPPVTYHAEHVLWALVTGQPLDGAPTTAAADSEAVWDSYAAAVRERNPVRATLALHTITELHIDLFGEGWNRFVKWDHPLFDRMACAGAALARHLDLVIVDDLTALDRRYLDAGLEVDVPDTLYPNIRPEPSVLAAAGS